MRKPLRCTQESYAALNKKTLAFFSTVARQYDAEYIVKVDDDAFVRLDRLSRAVDQWHQLSAGAGILHRPDAAQWLCAGYLPWVRSRTEVAWTLVFTGF